MQDIESIIIKLETSLFSPEVRCSAANLDKLLALNFTEIGASGTRFDKQHVLERLPSEIPPKIIATDFELRKLAPNCVQLLYRAEMLRGGDSKPTYSLRCSIWELKNNHWQMSYHQGTMDAAYQGLHAKN